MKRNNFRCIRGAFDPDKLREVRWCLTEEFLQQKATNEREELRVKQGVATDAVRFVPKWNEVWQHGTQELMDALNQFTYVIYPPQTRWVRQVEQLTPWHQDLAYMQGHGLVTCFVPLEENPAKCSTLLFGEWEGGEIQHSKDETYGGWGVTRDVIRDFEKTVWFPMQLGDCLIFGDLAPHRTYVPEGGRVNRRSLEFRLMNEENLRAGRDYFSIAQNKMIQR